MALTDKERDRFASLLGASSATNMKTGKTTFYSEKNGIPAGTYQRMGSFKECEEDVCPDDIVRLPGPPMGLGSQWVRVSDLSAETLTFPFVRSADVYRVEPEVKPEVKPEVL